MLTSQEDIELLEKDLCGRLPYIVYATIDVKAYLDWLPDESPDESGDEGYIPFKERMEIYLRASNKTVEDVSNEPTTISGFPCGGRFDTFNLCHEEYGVPVEFIKPFYRPMSSMTKEEESEYYNLLNGVDLDGQDKRYWYVFPNAAHVVIDWLDQHMFDHRGLIERGIAQEAPADMYVFFDPTTKKTQPYWRRR